MHSDSYCQDEENIFKPQYNFLSTKNISPYLATRKSLLDVLASSTESVFLSGQHLERLYGMYNLNNGNGMAVGQLLITSIYCTVVIVQLWVFSRSESFHLMLSIV